MNFANLLTILRIIIIPIFITTIKFNSSQIFKIMALCLFIVASITDALDGIVARKFNLISNFGKFFDPLADKILTITAMICLVELKLINSIILIIIITREFLVTSIRLAASLHGKIIAANLAGKLKTITQILAISFILFNYAFNLKGFFHQTANLMLIVATILTIISGLIYFKQNQKFIT